MTEKSKDTKRSWNDDDIAPWDDDVFERAEIAVGGKVVRKATGTLTKRGRPPVGVEPKLQVTLRLAPRVVRYFKSTGEGWQTRLNETLEDYVATAVIANTRRGSVSLADVVREASSRGKTSQSAGTSFRNAATGRLSKSKKSPVKKRTGTDKKS